MNRNKQFFLMKYTHTPEYGKSIKHEIQSLSCHLAKLEKSCEFIKQFEQKLLT